ncbi:MAG: hypothetical protein EOO75_20480 [Myxococcales bacterium]|nr:MAG: hypothetical protein EOO75_20480 [Myxococcales bacterium]
MLLLRPGERYEEDIDPMLICGAGKVMAGLRPGALVYPHYGYAPSTARLKKGALPPPPYVVESLSEPRDLVPLRSVDGDGGVYVSDYIPPPAAVVTASAAPALSGSAAPAASGAVMPEPPVTAQPPAGATPPALVDGRGPRMVVRTSPLLDASSATEVTMTVTLSNEGQRSALLHFRNDDVGFTVTTPSGEVMRCDRGGGQRGAVRDFFETLGPGRRHAVTLRLYEICPVATFRQPGIYSILADVSLQQDGDTYNLPATVAEVRAEAPSKLRVRTGRDPYHRSPPAVSSAAPTTPAAPVTP